MDYNDELNSRLKELRDRQDTYDIIDPAEPFLELDWSQDNRPYFRKLIEHKIVTKKQVEAATAKARQRDRLMRALGQAPNSPREYAALYAEHLGAKITYKGAITVAGHDSFTILDLARGARLTAGELDITYPRDAINDAVEDHYQMSRDAALGDVRKRVGGRRSFDWIALAKGCFSPDSGSPEFVAAVFKKFIWQVQRKLHNLPVSYPLMPVITGEQGAGKSWFVGALTRPIADVVVQSDFAALADDRNIDLWRSYVIILDEMAKAAKADVETIKHVITADYLERRPMRTNSTVTIRQCATFIATTNLSVSEIILDPTGIRRFCELRWVQPPRGFLDQFDFAAAWGSVQASDEDPMTAYMDELAVRQAETRNRSPIENWLLTIEDEDLRNLWEASDDGFLATKTLFANYLAHRVTVNGGSETIADRRSLNSFSQELGRLVRSDDQWLKRHRTSSANGYVLTRQPTPALAMVSK